MKFAVKLTLAITALLAVFLSLGGTLLLRSAFNSGLDAAVHQSVGQHQLEKYAFEADLLDLDTRDEAPTDEHLRSYADTITGSIAGDDRHFALYTGEGEQLFSNLPQAITAQHRADALATASDQCLLRSAGERTYLLMASRIDSHQRELWLLSAFDVSALYASRDGQLFTLWRLQAGLLALAVLITAGLSALLTRPIKKLSRASRSIAGGAWGQRTGVHSRDEIGGLARDFDTMAAAVEDRIDQLNDSIQRRDDFVSAFTHEIKTPMTSLIGYADLLRSAEYEPEVRQMAAGHIYHEAKRLEGLSQKLLELMGLTDESAIEMAPVYTEALYNDVLRSLHPLPAGLRMAYEGQRAVAVRADRVLAADLLRNLVTNALRAKPAGGVVRVHFRAGRRRCAVMVADTGCGIPAEDLRHITEPFYMVDKSRARRQGGSGIGLALGSRIAGLHGSVLRFRSHPGRGTVVRFTLPLAGAAAAAHRPAANKAPGPAAAFEAPPAARPEDTRPEAAREGTP